MSWSEKLDGWSKALGALRDMGIIAAGLTYAVGYVAWSIISAWYNWGHTPPTTARYIATGLPIMAASILFATLLRVAWPGVQRVKMVAAGWT